MLRGWIQTLLTILRALTVVWTSARMEERMLSLTDAGNDNGPCSPHSSTSQLPGSYWLLAPLVGMGNSYCPLLMGQSELTQKTSIDSMDKKQGVRAALEQPPVPPLGGGPTTYHPGLGGASRSPAASPFHPAFLVLLPPPVPPSQGVLHSI